MLFFDYPRTLREWGRWDLLFGPSYSMLTVGMFRRFSQNWGNEEVMASLAESQPQLLSVPGAMETVSTCFASKALEPEGLLQNPDIVQEFFDFMEKCAQHFVSVLYQLPPGSFDALITCAITALSLQERYSLVSASKFLVRGSTLMVTHTNLIFPSSAEHINHSHARQ